MPSESLRVQGLTWTPQGRRNPTLNNVSFTFPAGARIAVLGPSGAGKSTLLQALSGALADSGTGTLTGSLQAPQAGLLLQDPQDCVVADTAGRDVAFGLENRCVPREDIWPVVHGVLDRVGFPYGAERPTTALSGGQLQRLMLAGSLVTAPGMLLLDEPTAMLDAAAAAEVRAAVADQVMDPGTTLLVVEHRIGPWLDLLDHALVLGLGGVVTAAGELGQVMRDHREQILASGAWLPELEPPQPVPLPAGLVNTVRADAPVLVSRGAACRIGGALVGGADIEVSPGQLVAITGPSGAGKSTTLELLVGARQPDMGVVDPPMSQLSAPEVAQRVAVVPQHPGRSFMASTVLDELLTTPRALGRDETTRAAALLEHFGLSHLSGASPHSLSGGEQRRLSLATALLASPQVLALDEPTIGQDRFSWAVVTGVLTSAAAAGTAVVAASHDPELVELADTRIAIPPAEAVPEPPSRRRAVAGCRPLSLLASGLLAAVASLWIRTPLTAMVALGLIILGLPLYAPAPREALRRATPVLFAAATVGWSSWLLGDHDVRVAAVAMARIGCMVIPGAMLMAHIQPSQLGDDLAQRLRFPPRVVVASVVALQRLEHLQEVWRGISRNRRLRGLAPRRSDPLGRARSAGTSTFSLLVESLRAAGVTAVAMDARGFARAHRRTWAQASIWRARDTLAVLLGLAYLGVVVAISLTA